MIGALAALGLAFVLTTGRAAAPTAAIAPGPDVLSWTQHQRDAGFARMDALFASNPVKAGAHVRLLPRGAPLRPRWRFDGRAQTIKSYMASEHAAGLVVLQDGAIRFERYALGFGPTARWTSFSVAKSITSTLVGAAIEDGAIRSLADPVTAYIPELAGSGYDGVTIRQLLTMTSGVKWNEDYADPASDVARFLRTPGDPGVDATVSYMRRLPREAPPGAKWVYKTGETSLVGVLVARATHKRLSTYLSEKIWAPYGMEADAGWATPSSLQTMEPGGCCLSATLRDYARFGQFVLEGGRAGGRRVVPAGWFDLATTTQAPTGEPGQGYGFQWWTNADGTFDARGIFGQLIHIDPRRRLVVAMVGDWSTATGQAHLRARAAMIQGVAAAVDAAPYQPAVRPGGEQPPARAQER